jgi:hypothetical protein
LDDRSPLWWLPERFVLVVVSAGVVVAGSVLLEIVSR